MRIPPHREIAPAIHYWGTPVVLIGTQNPDGTTNLSPMSSAWWLGWSCMLGLDASSQTVQNLKRERECVLNLASRALGAVAQYRYGVEDEGDAVVDHE
jgi:flavin reductase (DIM6/NTAB) family NADH-FMN oxidoreductase RutF